MGSVERLRLYRSLSRRGRALLLNVRGLVPEHFVGKVMVELVALSEREVMIKITKVEAEAEAK